MRSAWSRFRARLSFAELPSVLLVLGLTAVVAQSTVIMAWVRGSEIFVSISLGAVLVLAVLAFARFVPALVALPLGAAAGGLLSWYVNAPALRAAHPTSAFGLPPPDAWLVDISGSDTNVDTALFLFLGCVIFWIVGGWLAWCSLRWRRPLLGLFPGATVFVTNVLNSKDEQNANTLYFLLLTIALLLWTNYRASLLTAVRSGLRLSSDSRWDFWETGVAATAGVMLLAIFVPPLSHDDQTVNVENGVFRNWAEFQQNLNHPGGVGRGGLATFSQGFALDAGLNGPLRRSERVVFVYTYSGQYLGSRYFRGVNLQNGARPNQWAYLNNPFGFQFIVGKNSSLPYTDSGLREQATATVQVHMLRPPATAADVLFYPGQLDHSDRDTIAVESYKAAANPAFGTIDKVASSHPATSAGFYKVTVRYANPTEDELRNAGTDYPAWIQPYTSYPGLTTTPVFASISTGAPGAPSTSLNVIDSQGSASPTAVLIQQLAQRITAKATNNYDRALAIETYLRSNYTYTLTPPPPKDGATEPIAAFLFDSKQGYCEYFATAMGDMLRTQGIPSRLVSGFGPGSYDNKSKQYVVRESDAHTWVEAYFPGYGWVPFEPTPDGLYFPISRAQAPSTCTRDQCATGDNQTDIAGGTARNPKGIKDLGGDAASQAGGLGGQAQRPYWLLFPFAILLLGTLGFFLASRYLRPHTAGQVWKRLGFLSRLAGEDGPPGETPSELGRRLAAAYPEAARPIRELTDSFVVAAYAPAEAARRRSQEVVERWAQIRPHLVRRLAQRLRPAW